MVVMAGLGCTMACGHQDFVHFGPRSWVVGLQLGIEGSNFGVLGFGWTLVAVSARMGLHLCCGDFILCVAGFGYMPGFIV